MAKSPGADPNAPPSLSEEWSNRALDTIDSVVDVVHDRVVRPVLIAGRGVVFGTIIAVVTVVVLTLLSIALVRVLTVYAFPGRVWAAEAVVGAFLCGIGFGLWTQRTRRPTDDSEP